MNLQPINCPGTFTIVVPDSIQTVPLAYRQNAWYGITNFENFDPCDQPND